MFNSALARSMPRATAWSGGQAKLGVGGRPHQVCFSVSGVNLNHAVHVFDSRSVLTQFGVNQGPVGQGVNVIPLQDYGLSVVFNGFPELSKVFVDHSQVVPGRDGSRVKGDRFFEVGQRASTVPGFQVSAGTVLVGKGQLRIKFD